MEADLHEAPVRQHLRPTREIITSRNGTVQHHMEMDGVANICIHAPRMNLQHHQQHQHQHHENAQLPHVFRYGLRIQTSDEVVPRRLGNDRIDDHLTFMEQEVTRVQQAMNHILHEANFAKDRDVAMHKQFLAMHSTTFYWPIVQLCVLLLTGFTQVRHIVEFFKRRRII